jgi:hypothetical protein
VVRRFVHDTWSALSHKEALGDGTSRPEDSPGWLNDEDARRLAAYKILQAMRDNVGRYFLPEVLWHSDLTAGLHRGESLSEIGMIAAAIQAAQHRPAAEKYREYGHPALLVAQARSLLLGDGQDIHLPDLQAAIDDRATADTTDGVDKPAEPGTEELRLQQFADWLDDWADDERLPLRLLEGEGHSIGDGDGVYALSWSGKLKRPRLQVYDPGWYFPDLATVSLDDDYPTTVHVAWVEEIDKDLWVVRHTWQLEDLPAGETRTMKWAETGDPASTRTCFYSAARYRQSAIPSGVTVYDLERTQAAHVVALVERTDTEVDFLPVVHVPNDAAGARHFGKGIILDVAMLLEDMAATDTDLQVNSELVGSTPLVTKGAGPSGLDAGPGAQWDNVDATFLDTSRSLLGLTGYAQHLADTESVNTRISSALLGRIKPNEVPSGVALQLGFAPTRSLVREMRLVRGEKYPLLLKFVMRFAQSRGILPAGPTPRAEIALGGYLPADRAAAVEQVKALLEAHAASIETCVQILVEADFPIEDAHDEVRRIKSQRFDDAVKLADALADDGPAYDFLGIPRPDRLKLPPLPAPPAGGSGQ